MSLTWVERWPDRVDFELRALEDAGIPYQRDDAAWQKGVLRLVLRPVIGGQTLDLFAEFPDAYPYFRFEVYAPALDSYAFDRKQEYFNKSQAASSS